MSIPSEQKNELLFMQLILTFHTAAMQHMGKIKNPLTDKIERDLNQAQMSIDMLDMIKAKTKGNLTESETKSLDRVLRELKLNYVDELEKDEKEKAAKEEAKKEEAKEKEEAHEKESKAEAKEETADEKK